MIHIFRKVVPKSIFNILSMKPTGCRHELDILTQYLYGYSSSKKPQPPVQVPSKPDD